MMLSASAPVPFDHDVTHRDLWVKLAELGGKLDTMAAMMVERKEELGSLRVDVTELYRRQARTDNRLAQIAILGLVLALLLPVAATLWAARVAAPQVQIKEQIR